ncbi:MAG: methyltransferase, partial [Muribaculaceae bacterium]|nr:methyltransferase [Muribaculaceae bacterium]
MVVFNFRQFDVDDSGCGMKICSDSVLLLELFLPQHTQAHTVLDIGAGSGLLSLMAAQYMSQAEITGIEIDEAAAAAARHNFAASQWARRLKIENTDFSLFTPSSAVDIIISNPPFFTAGLIAPDSRRATARHEAYLTSTS